MEHWCLWCCIRFLNYNIWSSVFLLQVSLPQRSTQLHKLKLSEEEQSMYNMLFARSRYECGKRIGCSVVLFLLVWKIWKRPPLKMRRTFGLISGVLFYCLFFFFFWLTVKHVWKYIACSGNSWYRITYLCLIFRSFVL